MKESSKVSGNPLGYLTAFTPGIICMGAIMFFATRVRLKSAPEPQAQATLDATAEPAKIHFQRGARPPVTAPPRPSWAGDLRPPSRLPVAAVTTEIEEPLPETQEPVAQETSEPIIVRQQTIVVAAPQVGPGPVQSDNTRVSGRVLLVGPKPNERILPLDPACAAKHPGPVTTRLYVTGTDNGLADVLIAITEGLPKRKWAVPRQPVTLRLNGCIYENHIVGVQAGQKLLVQNHDKTLHNALVMPERNRMVNRTIMPGHRPVEFEFSEPERFLRFKCDVHPWEFAYVNVMAHPFFQVTDANGNFALNGLEPGKYMIEAHHRKAGILQKEITVENHRPTVIQFEFKVPAPPAFEI